MGFTGTERFNAAWRELHQAATAQPLVLGTVIAVFGLLVITGLYLYSARNRGWGLRLALWPCALLLVAGAGWQSRQPLVWVFGVCVFLAVELGWFLGGRFAKPGWRHNWRAAVTTLFLAPFFAVRGSELPQLHAWTLSFYHDFFDYRKIEWSFLVQQDWFWPGLTGCWLRGLPAALLVASVTALLSILLDARRHRTWPPGPWRRTTWLAALLALLGVNWYVAGCFDPFAAVDDNALWRLRYLIWSRPGLACVPHRQDYVRLVNQAAMWGNVAAVRALLNAGAGGPAQRQRWWPTMTGDVLAAAAGWGQDDVVRLLLARHVGDGAAAAEVAAKRGRAATLRLLITARPETLRQPGPLIRAAAGSPAPEATLDVLLATGIGVSDRIGDTTVLGLVAEAEVEPEFVRYLLAKGAQVGAPDALGRTPLHHAAGVRRRAASITALVAVGADVNARDLKGATPLHYAAAAATADNVDALLAAGAEINACDGDGATPLDRALRDNREYGVFVAGRLRDRGGKTAKDLGADPVGEIPDPVRR